MTSHPATPPTEGEPAPSALEQRIADAIAAAGGWLPFDRYMELALHAPGLGYYARDARQFGAWAGSGSDFVTAPELSPLFGQTLARQIAEMLRMSGTAELWEFGAGSGALAEQVITELQALRQPLQRYTIVDISGALQARQRERLEKFGDTIRWANRLPDLMRGVVVGNELLDAVPVQLLARRDGAWMERGVTLGDSGRGFTWSERQTALAPPVPVEGTHDYVSEIHPQAEALVRTIAERLQRGGRGAALFIDYGFPEAEYYHPQRSTGTLVCHRLHRMDDDPLADVGDKDITTHVNFTGIALAAQQAGLLTLGYTSQARFLLNCGITERMEQAALPERVNAMKLISEHEMGELFKVIAFATGDGWQACGFSTGDRSHRL